MFSKMPPKGMLWGPSNRADRVIRPYKEFRRDRRPRPVLPHYHAIRRPAVLPRPRAGPTPSPTHTTWNRPHRADRAVRPCKESRRGRCLHRPAPPQSLQCVIARALCARGNPYSRPPRPPLGKGAINPSDASHPSSYRISQRACWKNIFYQLSFIPNRIDCSFSFQRLSVWMASSSVSVFGRICKMENWKNLYRSGCAQITSFISLLCPCSEST